MTVLLSFVIIIAFVLIIIYAFWFKKNESFGEYPINYRRWGRDPSTIFDGHLGLGTGWNFDKDRFWWF